MQFMLLIMLENHRVPVRYFSIIVGRYKLLCYQSYIVHTKVHSNRTVDLL